LKPRVDARAAPRGNALGRVVKPRRVAIATRSAGRRDDEDARDVSESTIGVAVAVVAAVASAAVGADGAEAYEAPVRVEKKRASARAGGTRDGRARGGDRGRRTRRGRESAWMFGNMCSGGVRVGSDR